MRHAPTAATRSYAFPADEPLDQRGIAAATELSAPARAEVVCSPSERCRATAEAAGLTIGSIEPAIAECDFGSWCGRSLDELVAERPADTRRWMADPDSAPHGGESLRAFVARVAGWLDEQARQDGTCLAITHGGVVKAAVVHALGAPIEAFWRVDCAPLARTELHAHQGRWTLTNVNVPVRAVRAASSTRRCRHERRCARRRLSRRTRSSAIRAGCTPSRASGRSRWPPSASATRRAGRAARSTRPRSWPRRRSPPSSAPVPPSALQLGRAGVLAVVTWAALGGRSLAGEARRLARRVEAGDLDGAREVLPSLCGRDPAGLDAQGLSRAAVESVAENTADAVVGALVWGAVAGPAGVAAYRAANTLDAMVGHRSERYASFGWAAARLDDVLSWPGARLGALLAALLAPLVGGSPAHDAARRKA